MRTKLLILSLVVVIVLPVAWYLLSPLWRSIELDEPSPVAQGQGEGASATSPPPSPNQPRLVAQAAFQPKAHDVAGKALLIHQGARYFLRFEDFDTVNGPDLRIYVSPTLTIDEAIEVGPIRATKGNVNYDLPPQFDPTRYDKVLVWCTAFGVLFSYADL